MSRDADVPQTVGEAEAYGWRWLTAECRGCQRRGEVALAELAPAIRLAAVGRCGGQRGGDLAGLGDGLHGAVGQAGRVVC